MKKILALALAAAMSLSLAACGGGNNSSNASSDGPIKVGVINNDPNESGYRTANDRAMREMFTEANGYSATFTGVMKVA